MGLPNIQMEYSDLSGNLIFMPGFIFFIILECIFINLLTYWCKQKGESMWRKMGEVGVALWEPSFSLNLGGRICLCYAETLGEYRFPALLFPWPGLWRSEVHAVKCIITSCWEFLVPKGSQLLVTTDSAWLNDLHLRVKCFPAQMHEVTDEPKFWHPTPPPSHWFRNMKRIPCKTQKPQMGYQFLLPFPILFKLKPKQETGLPPTVSSKLEILTSHPRASSVCD